MDTEYKQLLLVLVVLVHACLIVHDVITIEFTPFVCAVHFDASLPTMTNMCSWSSALWPMLLRLFQMPLSRTSHEQALDETPNIKLLTT